jgi:CheY-like chemotaxis protein
MECGTILIVDDNVDIRKFAKAFLESAGYTVITAEDGAEGLRLYEAHQSSIRLLLTDVTMPKMSGVELADRVLRIDSQIPVVLMSGDGENAYPGLECIAKPFRPDELIESVGRALKTQAA